LRKSRVGSRRSVGIRSENASHLLRAFGRKQEQTLT